MTSTLKFSLQRWLPSLAPPLSAAAVSRVTFALPFSTSPLFFFLPVFGVGWLLGPSVSPAYFVRAGQSQSRDFYLLFLLSTCLGPGGSFLLTEKDLMAKLGEFKFT